MYDGHKKKTNAEVDVVEVAGPGRPRTEPMFGMEREMPGRRSPSPL